MFSNFRDRIRSYFFVGGITNIDGNKIEGWIQVRHPILLFRLVVFCNRTKIGRVPRQNFQKSNQNRHLSTKSLYRFDWSYQVDADASWLHAKRCAVKFSVFQFHLAGSPWKLNSTPTGVKFAFLHIPKTGGTSIRLMLERAFGENSSFPNSSYLYRSGGRYPPNHELSKIARGLSDDVKIVSGHYRFSTLLHSLPYANIFTIVRDPSSQIISLLKHHSSRFHPGLPCRLFVYDEAGQVRSEFRNVQSKFLFEKHEIDRISSLIASQQEEEASGEIFSRFKQLAYIGVNEFFDDSVLAIEKLTGLSLGLPIELNVSTEKFWPIEEQILSDIAAENSVDRLLYDCALEWTVQHRMPR